MGKKSKKEGELLQQRDFLTSLSQVSTDDLGEFLEEKKEEKKGGGFISKNTVEDKMIEMIDRKRKNLKKQKEEQ